MKWISTCKPVLNIILHDIHRSEVSPSATSPCKQDQPFPSFLISFRPCVHPNLVIVLFLISMQTIMVSGLTEGEMTAIVALKESYPEFTDTWPLDPAQFCSTSFEMYSSLVLRCSGDADAHIVVLYGF